MINNIKAIIALMKLSVIFTSVTTIILVPLIAVWVGSICLIDWMFQ